MEARLLPAVFVAAATCLTGAAYRTTNFVVNAPTPELAKEIGDAAEVYRRDLSQEWLGRELPTWSQPCPIKADVSPHKGAGGATSFMFERGHPFGWRMNIQGPHERVVDSVLPHEITHTIFATHFGQPLPRWADEGACTTVEHTSERNKQEHMLVQFLTHRPHSRGIAFNRMFAMKEYPQDILPLYAQGYSVARFLIGQGGKQQFVKYVGEGMQTNNWPETTKRHYGFDTLGELQASWLAWVGSGSPVHPSPHDTPGVQVAAATTAQNNQASPIYRAQNEERSDRSRRGILSARTRAVPDRRIARTTPRTGEEGSKSWYVRQNDKASGQRTPSRKRDVFHPVDRAATLPETEPPHAALPESASHKTSDSSSRRVLLEWSRDDRPRPTARQPVRFDAPLSTPSTVWR